MLVRMDDAVELAVHNEGDGIPAPQLAAIFEPFYRTSSATASSQTDWDVGLTLVRAIAEAHGGTATVHSAAAKGTTFTVRLPMQALI